jgi:hypothetical protein
VLTPKTEGEQFRREITHNGNGEKESHEQRNGHRRGRSERCCQNALLHGGLEPLNQFGRQLPPSLHAREVFYRGAAYLQVLS